ncbi:MAG: AMP-binding protein, partial [Halieaceae bacterium]|nr:AMP-binding protein [Halieaceae bacterium]
MIYAGTELEKCAANHTALSPVSILKRVERVHPELPAQVHGSIRRNWGEVAQRCKRLASALANHGVSSGDTVALIAPNIPEALECALAIPMLGAVLNANNVRLDAATIAYILEHGEAKALLVDTEFSSMAKEALKQSGRDILVIDIQDTQGPGGERIGALTYDELLAQGDPEFAYTLPNDEWDALALNYTSGTTGRPKGVVYSHRGAWTNTVNDVITWEMPHHPVYLWTLPLFHCNGWCFPWTITLLAGTHVFLRSPKADAIY